MTKSKYANKTVEIIDEDGNRMRMNYIDAVDQNYIWQIVKFKLNI